MTAKLTETDRQLHKDVRGAGLVYVSGNGPGIRRLRHGKGFAYRDADGRPAGGKADLQRIRTLAIPPTYVDVWICAQPNGHLQATGYDARKRKQDRYHPEWHVLREGGEFERVLQFGAELPHLRRRVRHDLARKGLPQAKVLALLVRLLDNTLIRIGNDCYTRDNQSYGLTTLRSRHVRAERGRLRFAFRGKSGQDREIELSDKRLARIVRKVQQLQGQRLFQYIDDDGKRQPIDSGMVNGYLHGEGDAAAAFTAKDFRTWGGTVNAARVLAQTPLPDNGGERVIRSALAGAIKQVAAVLGNTPAVCRSSYIHPLIIEGWQDGSLHKAIPVKITSHPRQMELRTLRYLRHQLQAAQRHR
jgi:DNA topoisomerase-1